jgi:UDP:flavonoid glycosyltransferase YjiC (YdhE family)
MDWLPQQEIMAHPKTILFFTHFGMHGALEALWYGLPMVGMPLFSDQGDVRTKAEEKGVGRGIDMFASSDEIHEAIVEVRDNPMLVAYSHIKKNLITNCLISISGTSPLWPGCPPSTANRGTTQWTMQFG